MQVAACVAVPFALVGYWHKFAHRATGGGWGRLAPQLKLSVGPLAKKTTLAFSFGIDYYHHGESQTAPH